MRSAFRVRASAGGHGKQAAADKRRERRGSGLRRVFVQRMPCSRHQHKLEASLRTAASQRAVQDTSTRLSLKCQGQKCSPLGSRRTCICAMVSSLSNRSVSASTSSLGSLCDKKAALRPLRRAPQSGYKGGCMHAGAHAPKPSLPKGDRHLQRRPPHHAAAAVCRRHKLRREGRPWRSTRPRTRVVHVDEPVRPRCQSGQHRRRSCQRGALDNVQHSHAAQRGQARQLGGSARCNRAAHAVPDKHERRHAELRSRGVFCCAACKQLARDGKHVGYQSLRTTRRDVSKTLGNATAQRRASAERSVSSAQRLAPWPRRSYAGSRQGSADAHWGFPRRTRAATRQLAAAASTGAAAANESALQPAPCKHSTSGPARPVRYTRNTSCPTRTSTAASKNACQPCSAAVALGLEGSRGGGGGMRAASASAAPSPPGRAACGGAALTPTPLSSDAGCGTPAHGARVQDGFGSAIDRHERACNMLQERARRKTCGIGPSVELNAC